MLQSLRKFKYRTSIVAWIILLSGNAINCNAQINATVFEDFTHTIINPYLVNPSATDSSYSFKIQANNLNELGLIKNVSRFYLDADKRINSSEKNSFHFLGLQAFNSKFGDYIYRSRLQARYSWYTQVSRRAALSAGISIGFINFSFLTTQGGTGGSDYGPDGSVGIHYLRKNTAIGLAVQQLFTPVLIPVNQSFRLNRLYNFDFTRKFQISPYLDLSTNAVIQFSETGIYTYTLGFMSYIAEYVMIGINNFTLRKTSVNVGVNNIKFIGLNLTLLATYSYHHNSIPIPNNNLEIFIAIRK